MSQENVEVVRASTRLSGASLASRQPTLTAPRVLASQTLFGPWEEGEMAQRSDLRRFDAAQGPRILGPQDGRLADLGSIRARMMAWTEETGGGFSLVEHPCAPTPSGPDSQTLP